MYCSSCGAAINAGLSYCNRCGAEVGAKEGGANKLSELPPGLLVCAIVVITTVGLGAIFGLLALLNQTPQFAPVIMGFSVLSVLIVLATEILFIWLLLRSKTTAKGATGVNQLAEPVLRELNPGQAQMLSKPNVSVTEHTTRTLEPIQSQQKAE